MNVINNHFILVIVSIFSMFDEPSFDYFRKMNQLFNKLTKFLVVKYVCSYYILSILLAIAKVI